MGGQRDQTIFPIVRAVDAQRASRESLIGRREVSLPPGGEVGDGVQHREGSNPLLQVTPTELTRADLNPAKTQVLSGQNIAANIVPDHQAASGLGAEQGEGAVEEGRRGLAQDQRLGAAGMFESFDEGGYVEA